MLKIRLTKSKEADQEKCPTDLHGRNLNRKEKRVRRAYHSPRVAFAG
jgi:hypothetical protein